MKDSFSFTIIRSVHLKGEGKIAVVTASHPHICRLAL